MEKRKVLIQVATEFHYMVALSLVEKFYSQQQFDIHFIITENPAIKSRLAGLHFNNQFTYHRTSYNHHQNQVFPAVTQLVNFIKQNDFYHFVSFLYSDPLFVYLTAYFKSTNTKSYLAPDGMGAYVKFTSSNLRSRLYNTIYAYRFFFKHKLSFTRLWFTSWDFGANGWYDEIYAYSKTLPYISPAKKITEVDYTLSQQSVLEVRRLFNVDFSNIPSLENVVLIINEKQKTIQYEKQLIEMINAIMPGKQLLFKKHPNQPAENLSWLSAYKNVYIINEVFPAELLIASLKNAVIISSYSNSSMYHNTSCSYYWTYPIVTATGELSKPVKRFHPKNYIQVCNTLDELKTALLA
ncbi:MAG: hypothetical protein RL172_2978 [Bacteroidota bacterium]|jgi:hypothetical protein